MPNIAGDGTRGRVIYILLNILPIAIATLIGLVIGFVALRLGRHAMPNGRSLAVVALSEFWLASILAGAVILAPPQGNAWLIALASAFIIWIGFVMPVLLVGSLVSRREARPGLMAALHWLAVMLAMAAVLQGIGVIAPPSRSTDPSMSQGGL
ncbi:MAG: DUF1761 domain-containing protein [Alteraurantiacibacter sp.]